MGRGLIFLDIFFGKTVTQSRGLEKIINLHLLNIIQMTAKGREIEKGQIFF